MPGKKTSPANPITPADILADYTPEVRQIAEALRRLVKLAAPEASESAYPGWRGIGYRHLRVGFFCAIFPQPDHARLSFEYGVLLPDPQNVLQSGGRQVRYVAIREVSEAENKVLTELLEAALSLPESKAARDELVRSAARPAGSSDFHH
jgi:hypothetical protein